MVCVIDWLPNATTRLGYEGGPHGMRDMSPSSAILARRALHIEIVPFADILISRLRDDPALVHTLTADQFEELICDRLAAMGLEPRRIGRYNQRDGGIDVLFWPKAPRSFPFLGAAQIKHRTLRRNVGPSVVREFSATIANQCINAGIIVTNALFTADAHWFAREHAKLLRLRDFEDIKRWIYDDFTSNHEWREIPSSIVLAPGLRVEIRSEPTRSID
jgi:hypothetical protein